MSDIHQIDNGYSDPAFAPVDAEVEKSSAMTDIRAALAKKVVNEPILLNIPGRPGVQIRCNTNIEFELLQAWNKRVTRKVQGQQETDNLRLATIIVANQVEVVVFHGADATNEDGSPLNFKGPEIADMLGLPKNAQAYQTVRQFFGNDGHVVHAMSDILSAAGYDNDVDLSSDEDPTMTS